MSKLLIDIYKHILRNNSDALVIVDDSDNLWFLAEHVCDVLEFDNTKQAIKHNVNKTDIATFNDLIKFVDKPVKIKNSTIYVNEPGLYKLILSSKNKNAEKFRRWLFENVLISVRKTGDYEINEDEKDKLDELNEKIRAKFRSSKTDPIFNTEKQLRKEVEASKKELDMMIDKWNKLVKNGSMIVSIQVPNEGKSTEELIFELKSKSSDKIIRCIQKDLKPYIDHDLQCEELDICNGYVDDDNNIHIYTCSIGVLNKIMSKCLKTVDDKYSQKFVKFLNFSRELNKSIEVVIKIFTTLKKQKGGFSDKNYKDEEFKYKFLKYRVKYLNLLQDINSNRLNKIKTALIM